MRIPRQISGIEFTKRLKTLGYEITRQNGSHIRLTTQNLGQHHVTIPAHDFLRIGTLSSILQDVAEHFSLQKKELIEK